MDVHEGTVSFRGFNIWYQIVGNGEDPGKLPLLCLHGGPGGAHDCLESLGAMAKTGRRVIFYDQLGCGKSDRPNNPSMWTIELFIEELRNIRQALGLEKLHLLGHSWGGMLSMEYLLTEPSDIASLILASSPASMPQWVEEANRLRTDLPPDIQETLLKHEATDTTDDPAYEEAMMEFYKRHVCRIDPFPEYVQRSFDNTGHEVYNTMNGPSEFHVIGTLKDWDVRDRLNKLQLPTLVTSGRYDEATPLIAETIHNGIFGSEWVIFEQSSHMPHAEEKQHYMDVLTEFLSKVEKEL